MAFNRLDPKTYTAKSPNKISRKRLTPKPVSDQMAEVIGVIRESGIKPDEIASRAHEMGYSIAVSTIYRWLDEKTFAPRMHGAAGVMAACGYKLTWTRLN